MKFLSVCLFLFLPASVWAHTGAEGFFGVSLMQSGFVSGLLHPLLGLDHLLAIMTVGILSARFTAKNRAAIAFGFAIFMLMGFAWSVHSGAVAMTEQLILSSVVLAAVGLIIKSQMSESSNQERHPRLSKIQGPLKDISLNMTLGGMLLFAVFHGTAHGVEIPAFASMASFAFGFSAATLALILATQAVAQRYLSSKIELVLGLGVLCFSLL